MKAAAIDLGTNTFHLIIADLEGGKINVTYKTNVPVRLGEGRLNENIIIPEAFERGLQALTAFQREMEQQGVDVVKASATSAIRNALNGADFVQQVKERTGISIDIIDGDQEAEYIFRGVQATGLIKETSLIMDIGGGSTEFIICTADRWLWKKSYDIGAARLMQRFFNSDPISAADQNAITAHLDQQLDDLKAACLIHQPGALIGSAGAFESFAGMLNPELDLKNLPAANINLDGYHVLAQRLLSSTHAEREMMEGLIPLRVDMIVMAALLTNYILRTTGLKQLDLSTYDLKMGVLYTLLQENPQ